MKLSLRIFLISCSINCLSNKATPITEPSDVLITWGIYSVFTVTTIACAWLWKITASPALDETYHRKLSDKIFVHKLEKLNALCLLKTHKKKLLKEEDDVSNRADLRTEIQEYRDNIRSLIKNPKLKVFYLKLKNKIHEMPFNKEFLENQIKDNDQKIANLKNEKNIWRIQKMRTYEHKKNEVAGDELELEMRQEKKPDQMTEEAFDKWINHLKKQIAQKKEKNKEYLESKESGLTNPFGQIAIGAPLLAMGGNSVSQEKQ